MVVHLLAWYWSGSYFASKNKDVLEWTNLLAIFHQPLFELPAQISSAAYAPLNKLYLCAATVKAVNRPTSS